ncbi:unnamed protein product, partial [Phaeothamnion confervicola]
FFGTPPYHFDQGSSSFAKGEGQDDRSSGDSASVRLRCRDAERRDEALAYCKDTTRPAVRGASHNQKATRAHVGRGRGAWLAVSEHYGTRNYAAHVRRLWASIHHETSFVRQHM